jgi:hypothetical protein
MQVDVPRGWNQGVSTSELGESLGGGGAYFADEDSCSASDADSEGAVCAGGVMFEVSEEVGYMGHACDLELHVPFAAMGFVVDYADIGRWIRVLS